MVFSSEVFLFLFLPVTYLLYLAVRNHKVRNIILIIASLVFYAYGEPVAVLLMILSIVCNYFFGRAMLGSRKKPVLIVSVIFNVGMLFVFKYLTYTLSLVRTMLHADFPVPDIALPIGISFFTFQAMSYVIDSYKNPSLIRKNILDIFLYISFFPQLIAGPIIRFDDIARQIDSRTITSEKTADGIQRFICGLAKKVLIANASGLVADKVFAFNTDDLSIAAAWLGAVCYTVQIYFDFSGYSDMAIGLGKMFGFEFKENFNYPLAAYCMTDFWRKWNISVSTWFKEYVYIPMGGNRRGKHRTVINKMTVFLLTGIWHGANLTFVMWGLIHGLLLLLESYSSFPKRIRKSRFLSAFGHVYTIFFVVLAFVLFRADNIAMGLVYIRRMFTGFSTAAASGFPQALGMLSPYFLLTFTVGIIISAPVSCRIKAFIQNGRLAGIYAPLAAVGSLLLFGLCILALSTETYNPFIYFRF